MMGLLKEHARLIRDGIVVYEGKISELKDLRMMLKFNQVRNAD